MVKDDFLNEARFAVTYAGSKFRQKHWGKVKIKMMLQQKKVSASCIKQALDSIENYSETLQQLIAVALEKNDGQKYAAHKIAQTFIAKGFESELVWQYLSEK